MKVKVTLIIGIIMLISTTIFASEYPKAGFEKEMDNMGSLLAGKGVVFKPRKAQNTSTKAMVGNVNKYLYEASIDVLKFAPLSSVDSSSSIATIITEWYSPADQKNTQFKVTIYIKDQLITPEALDVVAFQRKKQNGVWSDQYESSPIAIVLEDKILRKARQLYQKSK